MPKGIRAFPLALAVIATIMLGQLGCNVDVQTEEPSRAPERVAFAAVATPGADIHDIGITAIDFDPALRSGSLAATDNINLLVAIENKGNQVEKQIVVQATLLGLPDSEALVSSQAVIEEIVPGESQVVRFSNFSSIPLRSAYALRVEVRPVQGEIQLGNNSRTYRLEVTVSSR